MTAGAGRQGVTMADVAARAGVSRALVSIVFRGAPGASAENREKVMRAAAELDYQLDHRARLLGRGRTRTLGVLFSLHGEFHGDLVERLYGAADEAGWDLALGATAPGRPDRVAVQALVEQRCEAVILLGPSLPASDIEALADRLPVVVLTRALRSRRVDVVRSDDVTGARLAVEHLAALGHRRLIHLDGGRAGGAAERRRGFRQAVADLELEGSIAAGGLGEDSGERALPEVLASGATGVVAFNDHCAAGLLGAARERGVRVPDDVSLVGYDDSRIAHLASVALTTVAQDATAMARSALELALSHLAEPTRPRAEVVVPPALVVRRTTGAPVATGPDQSA